MAYHLTKTWTTDGIYRETIEKRELRIAEGCDVVEMEAAALFAVAKFRNVIYGQILYAGDLVLLCHKMVSFWFWVFVSESDSVIS